MDLDRLPAGDLSPPLVTRDVFATVFNDAAIDDPGAARLMAGNCENIARLEPSKVEQVPSGLQRRPNHSLPPHPTARPASSAPLRPCIPFSEMLEILTVSPAPTPTPVQALAPDLARRFGIIVVALVALVARHFLRDPRLKSLILPLCAYLNRKARRFDRLMTRLAKNRAPKPRASRAHSHEPNIPRPAPLPTGRAWLDPRPGVRRRQLRLPSRPPSRRARRRRPPLCASRRHPHPPPALPHARPHGPRPKAHGPKAPRPRSPPTSRRAKPRPPPATAPGRPVLPPERELAPRPLARPPLAPQQSRLSPGAPIP